MGCDIHTYPEKLVDGKWVTAEPFIISKWWYERILDEDNVDDDRDYDIISGEYERMSKKEILEKHGDDLRLYYEGPWDDNYDLRGRDYAWFAILAGVRGILEPTIAADRGLPFDVSPEVHRQSKQLDSDGHSHSWVTLRELLDYDWDNNYVHYCEWVGKEEFLKFITRSSDALYVRSMRETEEMMKISNYQMGQICLGIYGLLDETKEYYTEINWDASYRDIVSKTYQCIQDKLATYGNPDEVRLVFWFDN